MFLSPVAPTPPRDGGRLRTLHLAAGLAGRGHHVSMIALDDGTTDPAAFESLAELGVGLTLVPHTPSWPKTAARSLSTGRSLYSTRFRSPRFARALREHLAQNRTDTVQCEYGYMSGYLLDLSGDQAPALILDEHNLEWELAGTGRVVERGLGRLPYRAYAARERRLRLKEEKAAAAWADRVLTVSSRDRDLLAPLASGTEITIVPNGVDTDAFQPSDRPEQERLDEIVFVGKLDYGPNVDGLLWFVRDIWPVVLRNRPTARLHIVGRDPGAAVLALDGKTGIRVVGEVADTLPHLESAAIAIVPLRRGGGTRLKILEALAAGRAVVSTALGAEGLELPPDTIDIADGAEQFARAISRLLDDPDRRTAMALRGRVEVCRRFAWDRIVTQLEEAHREAAGLKHPASGRDGPGGLL